MMMMSQVQRNVKKNLKAQKENVTTFFFPFPCVLVTHNFLLILIFEAY